MKAKLPDYVVKEVFCRVVSAPAKVSSSYRFIYKGNCPLCGDKRQRMFVKDYGDDFMVYCHNCSYSKPFGLFLKDNFPHEGEYLKQFYLESIKDGSAFKKNKKKPLKDRLTYKFDELDYKLRQYARKHGFSICEKQTDITLEKYRKKCYKTFKLRRMPVSFIKDLWCFTDGPLGGYCGIPFFANDGINIIHWQGRRMWEPKKGSEDEKYNPKYKFLKDVDEGIEIESKPFYGEHTVDPSKTVKITEGAPDSLCFDNGLATCGATISESLIRDVKRLYPHRIWTPDNIWLDKAGMKLVIKLLSMREKCFVFPYGTPQKDANSYIMDNGLNKIPEEFIENNTYDGINGLIKLRGIALKRGVEWPEEKQSGKFQKSSKGKSSDLWL